MDSISRVRLQEVMPELADKITQVMIRLEAEGTLTRVTQALRSWSAQDRLFAQGRTVFPGKIVTNVKGGYSYHNFGMAVDLVPSIPGDIYIPDWNGSHPTWKRMEQLGQSVGLASGALWRSFPDAPHFQLTGCFPEGEPDDEIRQLFKDGGMLAVWDEVRKSLN